MNRLLLVILVLFAACKQGKELSKENEIKAPEIKTIEKKEVLDTVAEPALKTFEGLADTTFVRLADFSNDFAYDMRYATEK